jgi:hypothetical protein
LEPCTIFHKHSNEKRAFCGDSRQARPVADREREQNGLDQRFGALFANEKVTMKKVSTLIAKPPMRESNLNCSRQVTAAGSLLDYWTDFGRLIT